MTTPQRLNASAPLADGTLGDFWGWAFDGQHALNNHELLAEYLVARAAGNHTPRSSKRAPRTLTASDGTRIEVTSAERQAGRLVSRAQGPRWTFASIDATKARSADEAAYVTVEPWDRLDVWVFALHTIPEPGAADPLSVDDWEFRVVPHRVLVDRHQVTIGLDSLSRLGAEPVAFAELRAAIADARARNAARPRSNPLPDPLPLRRPRR